MADLIMMIACLCAITVKPYTAMNVSVLLASGVYFLLQRYKRNKQRSD